tara:strand:+ start:8231 stop:9277 length:1047 start_codon:yes stop_codon:yes gene_type:complete
MVSINLNLLKCRKNEKVINAISKLNSNGLQILLIINKQNNYVGTLTDGDIRRGFIKGLNLESEISDIVNYNSTYASNLLEKEKLSEICQKKKLKHLPLINNKNKIVDLYIPENFSEKKIIENYFIIMAGGKGTRLRPKTKNLPKALIPVLNKPLIKHIIDKAKDEGFRNFIISTNYLKGKIKKYLGNGSKFNLNITYIDEKKFLGTVGSLSKLKPKNKLPIVITNCDVLTKIRYDELLKYHTSKKNNVATISAKNYDINIPFGVLNTIKNKFINVTEKPSFSYLINAGIYIIDQKILKLINKNQYMDMTTLFNKIPKKEKVAVYPFYEKWFDIADIEDIKKANINFYD